MKKNISILLLVIVILIIFTLILSAEEFKYDFRKTNWGMSRKQVKATEDAKLELESDTTLGYSDIKIDKKDFICVYSFLEDKLYRSGYGLRGKHSNDNLYIDDYEKLKETLTKKYGKPKFDKVTWDDDLYKDDRSHWGFAVSLGHLDYFSSWETSTTYISLRLNGDNYKISLMIAYESRELEEWVKKIEEEKAKSKF